MMLHPKTPEINDPDSPEADELAVRSLLMRLYRSRLRGEAYYPQQFVNGQAPALLAAGWIVERGQGYRLSETGVQAWAALVEPLMKPLSWMNELRALVGKEIVMAKLSTVQINILKKLAAAGGELPLSDVGSYGLSTLQKAALVVVTEDDLLPDAVQLTAAGRQALAQIGADSGSRPAAFAPAPTGKDADTPLPPAQACACEGCISKQALDLLAARYPKVRDLVEAMQRQQELLDTLTT